MNAILLQHNCPLRIDGAAGRVLECVAGTVWITSAAAAGDVFLRAGESHRLGGGLTLVEALGEARIVLHASSAIGGRVFALGAAVLSSMHERMRAMRHTRRRTPLAG